jgi:hypothetical protein
VDILTSNPTIRRILRLYNRPSTISQEEQDLFNEICSLRRDLQLNGNPHGLIDSVINSKRSSRLNKGQNPQGSAYIPHVKGVSEKFKRTGN